MNLGKSYIYSKPFLITSLTIALILFSSNAFAINEATFDGTSTVGTWPNAYYTPTPYSQEFTYKFSEKNTKMQILYSSVRPKFNLDVTYTTDFNEAQIIAIVEQQKEYFTNLISCDDSLEPISYYEERLWGPTVSSGTGTVKIEYDPFLTPFANDFRIDTDAYIMTIRLAIIDKEDGKLHRLTSANSIWIFPTDIDLRPENDKLIEMIKTYNELNDGEKTTQEIIKIAKDYKIINCLLSRKLDEEILPGITDVAKKEIMSLIVTMVTSAPAPLLTIPLLVYKVYGLIEKGVAVAEFTHFMSLLVASKLVFSKALLLAEDAHAFSPLKITTITLLDSGNVQISSNDLITGNITVKAELADASFLNYITLEVDGQVVNTIYSTGSKTYTFSLDTTNYSDGGHLLYIKAFDLLEAGAGDLEILQLNFNHNISVSIALTPSAVVPSNLYNISGTVFDNVGDPLSGATVTAKLDGSNLGTTTSVADGTYSFSGLTAPSSNGSYQVSVLAESVTLKAQQTAVLTVGGDITITANPSSTSEGVPSTISVNIKHADGSPWSGATIDFSSNVFGGFFSPSPPVTTTDGSGNASVTFTPSATGTAVITARVVGESLSGNVILNVGTPDVNVGIFSYLKQMSSNSAVYEVRVECRYASDGRDAQNKGVTITTSHGNIYPKETLPTGQQSMSTTTNSSGDAYAWLQITSTTNLVIGATCLSEQTSVPYSLRLGGDPASLYVQRTLSAGLYGKIEGMDWRPDNEQIAAAGDGNQTVYFFNPSNWSSFSSPDNIRGGTLKYLPNSTKLISIGHGDNLYVVNPANGAKENKFDTLLIGHRVSDVSSDSSKVAIGCIDGVVSVRHISSGAEYSRYSGAYEITSIAWSQNGAYIAAGDKNGDVRLFNAPSLNEKWPIPINIPSPGNDLIYSLDFSPDNSKLIATNDYGEVIIIRVSDGHILLKIPHCDSCIDPDIPYVYDAKWSPDGSKIVSGGSYGVVNVWDSSSGSLMLSASFGVFVNKLVWSTYNGELIILAGLDGSIKVLSDHPTALNLSTNVSTTTPQAGNIVNISTTVSGISGNITDALVLASIVDPYGYLQTLFSNYNATSSKYEASFTPSLTGDYTGSVNASRDDYLDGAELLPTIQVVNTEPDTLITSTYPTEGATVYINSVVFNFIGSDVGSLLSSLQYSYKLDSGGWSAYSYNPKAVIGNLTEGSHTFYVKAYDGSLEDSSPASRGFVYVKPGKLSVTPATNLNAVGYEGGPFSPSSEIYTLTNIGSTTINWSAVNFFNWIDIAPQTSGTLNQAESISVTVQLNSNANSLGIGDYKDIIYFNNDTNGHGSTRRVVNLTVKLNGACGTSDGQAFGATPTTNLCSAGNSTIPNWNPHFWTVQPGTSSSDNGRDVAVDGSGNTYVTGYTKGSLDGNTNAGSWDIFLTKYDSNGNRQWTVQPGTSTEDRGSGVAVDGSGNAYVTGDTIGALDGNNSLGGGEDFFLTKYDTNGNRQWTVQPGTVGLDFGSGIAVDGSGNSYVTGSTTGALDGNTNSGGADIFLTKYDSSGNRLWTVQPGTSSHDLSSGVAVDGNGNAYVTGQTAGALDGNTSSGSWDIFLTKYDSSGNSLWTVQSGSSSDEDSNGVAVDGSGNAYVTGYTSGGLDGNTNSGGYDIFLMKYDSSGNRLWTMQPGTSLSDFGMGVAVDGSGNTYVTGYTKGSLDGNTNAGSWDIFLTMYDSNGSRLWTVQPGTSGTDSGYGVAVDDSGNVYITGYTDGGLEGNTNSGMGDIFLMKINVGSLVNGSGQWSWDCLGQYGGTDASCSANKIENGACGISNGQSYYTKPTSGLCLGYYNNASAVSGSGPWSWSCSGTNGGSTASCEAYKTVDITAPETSIDSQPSNPSNSTSPSFSFSGTDGGSGVASYECQMDSGGYSTCTSPKAYAGLSEGSHTFNVKATDNAGNTDASPASYAWTVALTVNGACGTSNGQLFGSTPTSELCSAGSATIVNGTGPWTWSCEGANGGSNTSCSANTSNGVCGASDGQTLTVKPAGAGLCSNGYSSTVSGTGPWVWGCYSFSGGNAAVCSANIPPTPTNGACGTSNEVAYYTKPTSGLCNVGYSLIVNGTGPWDWSCSGFKGGTTDSCSAFTALLNGDCGTADGQSLMVAPTSGLCSGNYENASTVTGSGPWSWSCSGLHGGTADSCSANITAYNAGTYDGLWNGVLDSVTPPGRPFASETTNTWWYGLDSNGTYDTGATNRGSMLSQIYTIGTDQKLTFWSWEHTDPYSYSTEDTRIVFITDDGGSTWTQLEQLTSTQQQWNQIEIDLTNYAGKDVMFGFVFDTVNSFRNNYSGWYVDDVEVVPGGSPVNGTCGSSSGSWYTYQPTSGLCSAGSSTSVSGGGSWSWSCSGLYGGTTDSCSANVIIQNGVCGSLDGQSFGFMPTSGLCSSGSSTAVTGSGPWSWSCSGVNGGTTASCSLNYTSSPVDGACGSSDGQSSLSQPWNGLCSVGYSSTVIPTGPNYSGPWSWSCLGSNDGNLASCSANVEIVDGVCGTSDEQLFGSIPTSGLCSNGYPATVSGSGPWSWSCPGYNGGTAASCSADYTSSLVNGTCGASDGQSFGSTPTSGLCSTGNTSTVSGFGPWSWSCSGVNGGTTDNCSANVAASGVNGVCGTSDGQTLTSKPSWSGLCSSGYYSSVSGTGPWVWGCYGLSGGTAAVCSANIPSTPTNGDCGFLDGMLLTSKPSGSQLCDAGSASIVNGSGPWDWSCSGFSGGTAASCSANTATVNGTCGTADGQSFIVKPTSNLCSGYYNNESIVSGSGPWSWSCAGFFGGTTSNCSAAKVVYTPGIYNGLWHEVLDAVTPAGRPFTSETTNTWWYGLDANGTYDTGASNQGYLLSQVYTIGTDQALTFWSWEHTEHLTNPNPNADTRTIYITEDGGSTWTQLEDLTLKSTQQQWNQIEISLSSYSGKDVMFGFAFDSVGTYSNSNGGWYIDDVKVVSGGTPVNGQCGSSDGRRYLGSLPSSGYCDAGSPTGISGSSSGPWSWSCTGMYGGTTANCSTQMVILNGQCGTLDGQTLDSKPKTPSYYDGSKSLCINWFENPPIINGSGPWSWSCPGVNGGTTESCSAIYSSLLVDGTCGTSDGQASIFEPTNSLCSAGYPSTVIPIGQNNNGPWSWTCFGLNGGSLASCSATVDIVDGVCGTSDGQLFGSIPTSGLCSNGYPATVSGSGPWSWSCPGYNGGTAASCEAYITADITAPETTIDSQPSNPSNSTSPSFSFSGTDVGSGVASYECQMDSGGYYSCTSPKAYSGLSEGSHTFYVKATDNAGNTDASPASYTWTVDTIAPTTSIDSQPSNPSGSNSPSFGFSGTDGGTGVANYECQLDAGGYSSCTSPKSYSGLSEGSHTFYVKATDAAGNTDATPASYTWTVDTIAPTTSIDSQPSNPVNSNSPSFGFSANEAGSTFTCQLDAGGDSSCTSPKAYAGLSEGSHTFLVNSTDSAGNTDLTPASYTWAIDTTAPTTSIDTQPSNPANSNSPSFGFSGTDGGSGVASYECQLDAGGYSSCTTPKAYSGLSEGSHTFYVKATDNAGNTDASPARYTWIVDTTPVNGACGTSDGQSFGSIPTTNLCSVGSSTTVTGTGPWSWNCSGDNGGTTDNCSATKTTSPVDGVCGTSDGQSFALKPATNLCSAGTSSTVSGSGPWSWSCTGENSGSTASCSANKVSSNGWVSSGLWHEVLDTGTPAGRPSTSATTKTWWYGLDANGTYDNGAPNSGSLLSPVYTIGTKQKLTFWSWEHTEDPATTYWDTRTVYITDNGSTWTLLEQLTSTQQQWNKIEIDLSSYAGKDVIFEFVFDTVDADSNNYGGWYIDDVTVITQADGDVNGDEYMNITDALLIARYSIGMSLGSQSFDVSRADVNCDGYINITDAMLVARKSIGINVSQWWCAN